MRAGREGVVNEDNAAGALTVPDTDAHAKKIARRRFYLCFSFFFQERKRSSGKRIQQSHTKNQKKKPSTDDIHTHTGRHAQ